MKLSRRRGGPTVSPPPAPARSLAQRAAVPTLALLITVTACSHLITTHSHAVRTSSASPSSFDDSIKRFRRSQSGARLPHKFAGFQARMLRSLIPSEELEQFMRQIDGVQTQGAHLGKNGTKTKETSISQSRERRRSQVAFLHWQNKTTGNYLQAGSFAGERIHTAVEVGFDAWPETATHDRRRIRYEPVQYGVYSEDDVLEGGGSEGGFVSWHLDKTPSGPRRITVVVLLQKCQEGGEFMIRNWNRTVERNVQLEPGDAIVFPSMNTQHQVSPVMKGVRKSLVSWIRVFGTPDEPVDTSDVSEDDMHAKPDEVLALPRDPALVDALLR